MQTIAPAIASVNWQVATIRQRYNAGFDAYCLGATRDEVAHDPHMLRGWAAARRADAETAISGSVNMLTGEVRV